MEPRMSDQLESEVEEVEEYDPREMTLPEECIAVPDIEALEEAVIEMTGCDSVLGWIAKDGQMFALSYKAGEGFKWRDIESLKARRLKPVN